MLDTLPPLWLGQSVRTTMVVDRYPTLAGLPFMASLGDAIHRPRLIDGVFRDKLRSRLRATGPLMLDSGGFTLMMRSSATLNVATLCDLYQTCGADLVVALDQPVTHHDPLADRQRKHAVTLENLKALARGVDHACLVPVIHGPDIADIARNAAASAAIAPGVRLVALGGLVPMLRYSAHRPDDVGKAAGRREVAETCDPAIGRAFYDWIAHRVASVKSCTSPGRSGVMTPVCVMINSLLARVTPT